MSLTSFLLLLVLSGVWSYIIGTLVSWNDAVWAFTGFWSGCAIVLFVTRMWKK